MANVIEFKPLRLEEIKQQYDGEWVLIVNPMFDENLEVIEGEVWAHSTNVEMICRKGIQLRSNIWVICLRILWRSYELEATISIAALWKTVDAEGRCG
jgi:hypothetical protein